MRSSTVTRRIGRTASRDEETTENKPDNTEPSSLSASSWRRKKHRNRPHFSIHCKESSKKLLPLGILLIMVAFVCWFLLHASGDEILRSWSSRIEASSLVLGDLNLVLPVHGAGRVHLPTRMERTKNSHLSVPDFGGLNMTQRIRTTTINIMYGPDDKVWESFQAPEDESLLEENRYDWYYYAFDDDEIRNPYHGHRDKTKAKTHHCRRVSWHRDVFPNCNEFHATDLRYLAEQESVSYIGGGGYRNVFLVEEHDMNPNLIFKVAQIDLDYKVQDFEFMRMEGGVNAAITPHPRVVSMYGFCALSMFSEALMRGNVEGFAMPSYQREHCDRTPKLDGPNLVEMNQLLPVTKLEWSLDMAEAVALLHNHRRGVIVHDDIQLSQFLIWEDGHLKMGDFNRAEIMLYDEEDEEYCTYRNGRGRGDWRAPQEYRDEPLDEKIDIWSLGMNMYTLLTGVAPMHNVCSEKRVIELVKRGRLPFLHPKWALRSFAESQLTKIIRDCLVSEPEERMSIVDLVQRLRQATWENRRRDASRGQGW